MSLRSDRKRPLRPKGKSVFAPQKEETKPPRKTVKKTKKKTKKNK